ncbi:GSU3473 family protein [Geomonas edaphica]|uniref:GSU3473 family protein n=1 Tax=Geomonas edaphica TaxID=2570226 RepID=UPI0010A7565C
MLVQVHWTNKRYDYVKDYMLDSLIEAGVVARFLRSSGWVTIGVDPVRSRKDRMTYSGPERRHPDGAVA